MTGSKRHLNQSSSLRIGFDTTPLFRKTDGIGRYTYNLIDAYASSHPEDSITLVCFLDDAIDLCDLQKKHTNITIRRLPFIRKLYQGIYSRLFKVPVDIFLPTLDAYICTNFVRYPFVKNIPVLTVIHDLTYKVHPETVENKNRAYLEKHVQQTVEHDHIIAVSDFTKKEIEAHLGIRKTVSVVPNGVGDLFIQAEDKKRKEYILAVGTIEPRKNLLCLLEAYKRLPETLRKKHPLIIVGNGGWGDIQIPFDENISYTGYVEDSRLVELYKEARLFAFPSLYEGFGLPVLEALATNTPIVCSNIPPLKAIAGDQATYFNPRNSKSIAAAIEEALQSTIDKPASVIDFTWKKSASQLRKAIELAL